jgi:hypothetical protein
MRRVAISIATALSVMPFAGVIAQVKSTNPGFGVYAGWDRTTLHGNNVPGPLHLKGWLGGAYLQWHLGSSFDFQPEVQYVQKGVRELETVTGGQFLRRIRLNYVEIPLFIRWNGQTDFERFTPFLMAGPEIAFKAGCDLKVYALPGSFSCDDLPNKVESYDYGVIAAGGVDALLGGRHFALSARYDHGLYDVFENAEAKNRSVSIVLSVGLK